MGAKNPFVDLNTFYLSEHVSDPPKLASLNKTQSLYAFAKYVKGTLVNYFASTDREILREHIPRYRHSDSVRAITSMLEETVEVCVCHFVYVCVCVCVCVCVYIYVLFWPLLSNQSCFFFQANCRVHVCDGCR